jgi:hypothetical protein
MIYKDYLNSARKHQHTCDVLIEKLDQLDSDNRMPDMFKYNSYLLNLYYLSGYIIECIVKYGIYDLLGHKKEVDIKELNKEGLTYKDIKHHEFESYTDHLNKRIHVYIPLITNTKNIKKEIIKLYDGWNSSIRYSYFQCYYKRDHFREFYKYSKEILRIISVYVGG